MPKAKVDIKAKVDTRAKTAKAEERALRACSKERDHAKASKEDPIHPRGPQSCSYRRRHMAHPLLRPRVPRMSPATSVTRKVITSPNALNG